MTEVYFNFTPPPAGVKEHYEWFEIFNPTTNAVVLNGWSVQDTAPGQVDALPTFTMNPGEFVIIAGRTNAFLELHPGYTGQLFEVADGVIGSGLNTFGDGIRLRNALSQVVDAVSYGASTAAFSPSVAVPASGASIERSPANNDTNNRNDWKAQGTPNPGVGTLPSGLQNGDTIQIIFDVELNCDAVSGQFFSSVGFEQPPGTPKTQAGATFISINRSDLVVTKTPILQAAGILDEVIWSVRVANEGFGGAHNVVLRDAIGPGLAFTGFSVAPTNGVWGSTVAWDSSVIPAFTNLPAQSFVDVVVTAKVVACSGLFNTADAQSSCGDLVVLPNEVCEDTALNNETATAGIFFLDGFPNLKGALTPTKLGVSYCEGSSLTLHLTNQTPFGPAVNIAITNMLPQGWTLTGDLVDLSGVIHIDSIAAGASTSLVVNVQPGGDCPIVVEEQPVYFYPSYEDGCGNPYFGPLLFGVSELMAEPMASVTKIMPPVVSGDDGSFPVIVALTYTNFVGTEAITLTDIFPSHPNLSPTNISSGGVLSGGSIIWSNLVPGAGSGVLTTTFDMVINDPCAGPINTVLFNEIQAHTYTDCRGCEREVAGSGFFFPIDFDLGAGCSDPGLTGGCSFVSAKDVFPALTEVCDPVSITHVVTNFSGSLGDWTGVTFRSDLAGGSGYIDSTNEVVVLVNGSDVTSFVTFDQDTPNMILNLAGLNGSGLPNLSAVTSLTITWPVSVAAPGQFVDISTITIPSCGTQSRSVL